MFNLSVFAASATMQRRFDGVGAAPWLITLHPGLDACYSKGASMHPQVYAVMDDFGYLVVVVPWM